ncbi:hypothetical protein PUN28_008533 [Cardiocondyla obscurior]|uniref:Uncharacterized protein n=1 Tax=Cardiocondyla obscurior TaxID=286306 RepID=A0AAW2G032_9HYME
MALDIFAYTHICIDRSRAVSITPVRNDHLADLSPRQSLPSLFPHSCSRSLDGSPFPFHSRAHAAAHIRDIPLTFKYSRDDS